MIKQLILVGSGGAAGCILRYLTTVVVMRLHIGMFPLATFLVNMVGCFIIGLLTGFFSENFVTSHNLRLLFITGFCGGYTTFSTFAMEGFNLFQENQMSIMLGYTILSVVLGIILVWLGLMLGMSLIK